MRIIDIVSDDIATLKILLEILNGFIPEANADIIKDSEAYNKTLTEKKSKKTVANSDNPNEEDTETLQDIDSEKNKSIKTKKTITTKAKKNVDVEQEEDDDNIEVKGKKNKKKLKQTKEDVSYESEEEEEDKKVKKNKKKDTKIKKTKVHADTEDQEENKGEIKILTSDPNQVMITFITLKGSSFKKFNVLPDKYTVGLNLDELYRYIKNVDKDGTLNIYVDADDTQHIVFDVDSPNSAHKSICELRVLNLSSKRDRRIEANVLMAVRINCHTFHKACKDLLQFSQFVEITCDPTQFVITCKGDLSNHSRIFKVDGNNENSVIIKVMEKEEKTPSIIRLVFDLKYINSLYKCPSLCDDMEIYLDTDSVMFLKYGIVLSGEMMVGIAPASNSSKKKEFSSNYDDNDDAYYQDDEEIQLR